MIARIEDDPRRSGLAGKRLSCCWLRRSTRSLCLIATPVLIVQLVLLLSASFARAELHRWTALIPPGPAWDFSDSAAVVPPNGDLRWTIVRATNANRSFLGTQSSARFPEFWLTNYPALIAYAPQDSTYDELTTAPGDTTLYKEGLELFYFAVYVVRTKEHHYAKLKAVCCVAGGIQIEYTYQDNGTRILVDPVPVRPTTWGRIKSLYRQ